VRGVEEGSPTWAAPRVQRQTGKRGSVDEIEKVGGKDGSPPRDAGIVWGFWESPGGTIYDLDD
jgi:hypothetical protein